MTCVRTERGVSGPVWVFGLVNEEELELAVDTAAAAPSEVQVEGGFGRSEEGDEGI